MNMLKYVLKSLALVVVTFMILLTLVFALIKSLQPAIEPLPGLQAEAEFARREALGYNKPIMTQYGIYLRNVFTEWDWGTSWKIDYMRPTITLLAVRLPPTVIMNAYSLLFSIPLGIILGVIAAIKKNSIADHAISILVMLFISVPPFVYAFIVQYLLGFKLGLFPVMVSSLHDAGGSWLTLTMLNSMVLPILSLAFGAIAGLARSTRAELTEALTSEYMLLARAKGLSRSMAITRHAIRNAMVPILPGILASFIFMVSGSIIIEQIFIVNGVGKLTIQAFYSLDYDVFVTTSMFYTFLSLTSMILIDLSYGFLDPRVRMGER